LETLPTKCSLTPSSTPSSLSSSSSSLFLPGAVPTSNQRHACVFHLLNVPRWLECICVRQIKSSLDVKSSHMLLTLLYLKAVFRNNYLTSGQCAYVAVKIVQNYLNESTQTNLPMLATYPSGLYYELCIAQRFYFGICELSFRSVWDMTLCHWLNASRRSGGTSEL
jgi:hypothetical protein